jgi:acyl-CoA synthetase (AMP-forming)/AMP-acid ligase II/acyl carrier protein
VTVQSDVASLGELLAARARLEPDRIAFRELRNDLSERDCVTYAQLHERALRIGERLAGCARPGDRALLITPHAIDYLAGLFGCFYAGVVAVSGVPAYAPSTRSLRHTARLRRLHAVIEDSAAGALIGPRELLARIDDGLAAAGAARPACIALDDLAEARAPGSWRPRPTGREAMAVLQYTSGSTSSPGGVVLRHRNLMDNLAAQEARFAVTPDDVAVSWLPLHHDLGLIGGCLLPVYVGFPSVLLPPAGFLEQPRRWLQCLSAFGGTISWAPNFAYRLCLRAIPPEERAALDLRRWRVAMNAAEPVRAETIRAFTEGFRSAGLDPRAAYPSYGLAEATLAVSAPVPGSPVRVVRVDKAALTRHEVVLRPPGDGEGTVELVACGQAVPGVGVVIADPQALRPCPPRRVGEIWVSGPGKSEGYFAGPGGPRESFDGRLPGDPAVYLRTGDLGFLLEGDLFITGRLKDVIILRGANIYPQDLETTAAASHPALREDCACAFATTVNGEEALVIACEIDRRRTGEAAEAVAAMRRAVFEDHGLETYAVAAIPFSAMPKTPSGKVQRKACAQEWRSGALPVLHESRVTPSAGAAPAPPPAPAPRRQTRDEILAWVLWRLSQFAPDAEVEVESDLSNLGLSSVQITELAGDIQARFGRRIPAAELFECRRVADVVARLDQLAAGASAPRLEGSRKRGSLKAGSG